jgi:peroxiredoxin
MSHQALIGKPAPTFTLPNYNGENFTLKPGEDGLPIALFIYPKSGIKSFIFWGSKYTNQLTIVG